MKNLKKRWGLSSNLQFLLIITVFSITGSSSIFIAKPILGLIGLARENFSSGFWWGGFGYYFLRILIVFPIYQVLLVAFGWLFGQFNFFWAFEKKMLRRIGLARYLS